MIKLVYASGGIALVSGYIVSILRFHVAIAIPSIPPSAVGGEIQSKRNGSRFIRQDCRNTTVNHESLLPSMNVNQVVWSGHEDFWRVHLLKHCAVAHSKEGD